MVAGKRTQACCPRLELVSNFWPDKMYSVANFLGHFFQLLSRSTFFFQIFFSTFFKVKFFQGQLFSKIFFQVFPRSNLFEVNFFPKFFFHLFPRSNLFKVNFLSKIFFSTFSKVFFYYFQIHSANNLNSAYGMLLAPNVTLISNMDFIFAMWPTFVEFDPYSPISQFYVIRKQIGTPPSSLCLIQLSSRSPIYTSPYLAGRHSSPLVMGSWDCML